MSLTTRLNNDLKDAMRAKDAIRVGTLRMLVAAINNEGIEKYSREKTNELTDDEVIKVLKRELKKRRESFDVYNGAGRTDLAGQEKLEGDIIASYLPKEMNEDELRPIVQGVIDSGAKDLGSVMKQVMQKTGGKAPGKLVSDLAKAMLND